VGPAFCTRVGTLQVSRGVTVEPVRMAVLLHASREHPNYHWCVSTLRWG
jgi:hypothetical protein